MPSHARLSIQARLKPLSLRIRTGDQTPAAMVRLSHPHGVVCSYPKSGNTWLSFLLANLIRPESHIRGSDVQILVPDIHHLKACDIACEKAPRLFKSHEPFRADYDKVAYLYRDPRDVALSYYHYGRGLGDIGADTSLDDFAAQFTSADPSQKPIFGNWGEHVGSWFGACESRENFLPVSYENLLASPETELARIAAFLGIDHNAHSIRNAVQQSTADKMRTLEKNGELHRQKKANSLENLNFVRKARAGSWREELTPQAARRIEEAFAPMMEKLGYL